MNTYIGGFGASVRDFVLMHSNAMPVSVRPVEKTSLLLSNLKGQVTWKPPASMPFQGGCFWGDFKDFMEHLQGILRLLKIDLFYL